MAITYTNIVNKVMKEMEQLGKKVIVVAPPNYRIRPRIKGQAPPGRVQKQMPGSRFVIECETVDSPLTLATFLHEIGHVVNNDCEPYKIKHRSNRIYGDANPHVIRQEIEATRYALRRMREFGIPTRDAAMGLTNALRSYGAKNTFRT